tara:strand:- start:853 stop:1056 length:204 start_codon:yes stop_codon:yes gene_type:complete
MKTSIIAVICLTLGLATFAFGEEKKCGAFDVGCKAKKFIEDTKKFQKKGLEDGIDQIKNIPENLKKK